MTSEGDDKETEPAQVPPKKELDEEKKAKLNEAMQKAKAIAARLAAQKKESAVVSKKRPVKEERVEDDEDDVPYARRESSLEPHEQPPYKRYARASGHGERFDRTGRSVFMNQPGTQMQEFSVPQTMVGLIIGRGGDTLKRIEQVTGTKVQFASSELGHSEPIRRVTVQGPLDGIKEARAMIQKVMDASSDGGVAIPAAPTAIPAALPSVSYKIPNHKVGLAIGRGGETIKMLQDRSGAKVFIAPDHSVKPGESDRHVSIAGDEASIARAKTLLNELVTHGTMEGTYYASAGGSGGMAITLPPGALTDVCEVPNDAAGVVIGKNGETVKWLMQQTGARIQVEQPTVQSAMRKIHLSGTPETIAAAKALIMEQVAAKSRGEPSGPAMYGDASAVGLYDAYGAYGGGYDYSAYYAQYGQAAGTGEAGGEYAYAPYAQQAGGDYAQYMQQPGEYAPYAQQQPGQQGEYDYAAYYAYYQQQPPPPPPM